MKNNFLRALLAGALAFSAPAALGQETQDGLEGNGFETRPAMPRLFFTNQQRRILEVIRQEYVTEETLDHQEFVPFVLEQQEVADVAEAEFIRETDFRVDAFVRNRKTGSSLIWLNNQQYELGDASGILTREGLSELGADAAEVGGLTGRDVYNNSRFVVKVGQSLVADGDVVETYPVVIVKKK